MTPFKTAWELARERARQQDRRLGRIALARPVPLRETVAKRPAEAVPFTPPAVTILAPKAETAEDVRRFVVEQFREASRKGEKPK